MMLELHCTLYGLNDSSIEDAVLKHVKTLENAIAAAGIAVVIDLRNLHSGKVLHHSVNVESCPTASS